jgi:hypothetical protein
MRARLLSLVVLTLGLLVGALSSAATAHPAARSHAPVELTATRTGEVSAPFDQQQDGGVTRFSVTEKAVTTGDGIYMREKGVYRCAQSGGTIQCRGTVEARGTVLGQKGTVISRVSITCDLALNCDGHVVLRGVRGQLADLWGTATSSSAAGVATVVFRLYGV